MTDEMRHIVSIPYPDGYTCERCGNYTVQSEPYYLGKEIVCINCMCMFIKKAVALSPSGEAVRKIWMNKEEAMALFRLLSDLSEMKIIDISINDIHLLDAMKNNIKKVADELRESCNNGSTLPDDKVEAFKTLRILLQ